VQKRRDEFKAEKGLPAIKPTKPEGGWKSEEDRQTARREVWANVRAWAEDESANLVVGGQASKVVSTRLRTKADSEHDHSAIQPARGPP
jgi:protein farnesyltransferase subunit beta